MQKPRFAKCYMCHEPATTREHVPPKSFFPDGHKTDLLIVPSCAKHNNGNSSDVEYVRGIISSAIHVNETGQAVNRGKVKRSYDRSPGLLRQSFKGLVPVLFQGEETAAFDVDKDRLDTVISAIAHGVYFHHFGRHCLGRWKIVCTQFISTDPDPVKRAEAQAQQQKIDEALHGFFYGMIITRNPDVFTAELYCEDAHRVIFRFRFYGDLTIYAVGIPFYRAT